MPAWRLLPATTSPSHTISPALGSTKPAMDDSSVDLPQPLGPSRQTNSPGCTCMSIPATISAAPKLIPRSTTSMATPVFFLPGPAVPALFVELVVEPLVAILTVHHPCTNPEALPIRDPAGR